MSILHKGLDSGSDAGLFDSFNLYALVTGCDAVNEAELTGVQLELFCQETNEFRVRLAFDGRRTQIDLEMFSMHAMNAIAG